MKLPIGMIFRTQLFGSATRPESGFGRFTLRTVANLREPDRSPPPPPATDPEAPVEAGKIADGGRGLVWRMLDELDVITSRRGELEDMIVDATDGGYNNVRRDAMMREVGLTNRANTIKTLALALKTLNEASVPAGRKVPYRHDDPHAVTQDTLPTFQLQTLVHQR